MQLRLLWMRCTVSALLLLTPWMRSGAQSGDDQGYAQFTRENTLRGTVTGAARDGFDIRTDAGENWRVLYGPNTKMVKGREPVKPADVHTGDMLFIAGNVDAKKKQVGAAILVDIDAEEVRKAKEGLGKTWSAGRVKAVEGRQITIDRMDGAVQTIAVDENTSFQQRHESVTLADVKPGEGVRADGHLVNGVFFATVVHVFHMNGKEPWMPEEGGKR